MSQAKQPAISVVCVCVCVSVRLFVCLRALRVFFARRVHTTEQQRLLAPDQQNVFQSVRRRTEAYRAHPTASFITDAFQNVFGWSVCDLCGNWTTRGPADAAKQEN